MISIVVTGRNDEYAGGFRDRLLRTCRHNASRLAAAGIEHEFVLVEWNPVAGRPLLAEAFCEAFHNARAIVVPLGIHRRHVTNPHMPFDEMAAKNVGLRRSRGAWTIATNADILFGPDLVERLRAGLFRDDTLYRAHRIDVPADTDDDALDIGVASLPSGEGASPPCYYLGAGGDFCLAATRLWHRLGGFNQRVRFSTRAKDWQFFLSAAGRGVAIEFIGKIFHLDHAGGFRNTPPSERNSGAVHFGGLWDIEFGLPLVADPSWGFPDAREGAVGDRVAELSGPAAEEVEEDGLAECLAWPAGAADRFSALAAHAVFRAAECGTPLHIEASCARDAVAIAGLAAVGAAHGVVVTSAWTWPPLPDLRPRPLSCPAGVPGAGGLAMTRAGGRFELVGSSADPIGWLPTRLPLGDVPHNPMLGRRLLRAWLRLCEIGARRLAIYGAGSHTEELLRWGVPDRFSVQAVLVTTAQPSDGRFLAGVPVRGIGEVSPADVDAVLLSSIPYESEMAETARQAGFATVVPLWSDWPREFWNKSQPA
jgi:hypothetical protein